MDPFAGSYYVEHLTDEIERHASEYIRKIDEMGGAVRAVESGFIEEEIQEAAYSFQKDIESGDRVIVGVNRFQIEEKLPSGLLRVDPAVHEQQIKQLEAVRQRRDSSAVENALAKLKEAAQGPNNLMPLILDAVKKEATLGEICDVLRGVFGEYTHASRC